MPSILPDFEYDIFISYRHNDNLDGWVTDFVQALERELKATLKEPVSIYFDQNPHDGLLETHQVDKSLEGKLRCLLFVPIISQTYCDRKSFAWQQEFCAFNQLSQHDGLGRDIRLGNGNVSHRILPVRIHELDDADRLTLETEMGGPLRAIDFIYREPGVNRPLKPGDNKADNQNRTDYRNQVNKVANAVKDLLGALTRPANQPTGPMTGPVRPVVSSRKPWVWVVLFLVLISVILYTGYRWLNPAEVQRGKSIAVLPFENLSTDTSQEYFSDGLTEEIIHRLTSLRQLRVISRTSVMSYKNSEKRIPEIAKELGVSFILEGSVRRESDRLLITAQLIEAATDRHIWSQTFDRQVKQIFEVQNELAGQIAKYLRITITRDEQGELDKIPTFSIEAYDLYLQAREYFMKDRAENFIAADRLLRSAIRIDPNFVEALELMTMNTFFRTSVGGGDQRLVDSVKFWASRTSKAAPGSSRATLALGYAALGGTFDWSKATPLFIKANRIDPTLANRQVGIGMTYLGKYDSALLYYNKAARYEPRDPKVYVNKASFFYELGITDSAKAMFNKVKELDLRSPQIPFFFAMAAVLEGNVDQQIQEIEKFLESEQDTFYTQFSTRLLGRFHAVKKNWEVAYTYLLKWEKNPAWTLDAMDTLVHHMVAFSLGKSDEATLWLNSKLALDEKSQRQYAAYMAVVFQMKGDYERATEYKDRAMDELREQDGDLPEMGMVLPYWNEIKPGPKTLKQIEARRKWLEQKRREVGLLNRW